MCIVNVSTFHFGASTPPPPQKEGKKREIDEGLIIFFASEQSRNCGSMVYW